VLVRDVDQLVSQNDGQLVVIQFFEKTREDEDGALNGLQGGFIVK
jgi:hypothetical protein